MLSRLDFNLFASFSPAKSSIGMSLHTKRYGKKCPDSGSAFIYHEGAADCTFPMQNVCRSIVSNLDVPNVNVEHVSLSTGGLEEIKAWRYSTTGTDSEYTFMIPFMLISPGISASGSAGETEFLRI